MYTLNLHDVMCQLYLSKAEKRAKGKYPIQYYNPKINTYINKYK